MRSVSLFALRTDFAQPILQRSLPISPARLADLARIRNPHAQNRSVGGELLLCWAVRQLRPQNVPIPPRRSMLPQGKPYFAENPGFHFSLSHSGCWAVLAVSDVPVGVDVERCGASRPHLVRRYFHPEEQAFFFSLPAHEQAQAFYQLWVLKESAVKALGTGMHLPFHTFAVLPDAPPQATGLPVQAALLLPDFCDPAYLLGVCALDTQEISAACRTLTLEEVLR